MFPYSYIKGLTPNELVDKTQETIDIIRGNAKPGHKCYSMSSDGSAYDSNQTKPNM